MTDAFDPLAGPAAKIFYPCPWKYGTTILIPSYQAAYYYLKSSLEPGKGAAVLENVPTPIDRNHSQPIPLDCVRFGGAGRDDTKYMIRHLRQLVVPEDYENSYEKFPVWTHDAVLWLMIYPDAQFFGQANGQTPFRVQLIFRRVQGHQMKDSVIESTSLFRVPYLPDNAPWKNVSFRVTVQLQSHLKKTDEEGYAFGPDVAIRSIRVTLGGDHKIARTAAMANVCSKMRVIPNALWVGGCACGGKFATCAFCKGPTPQYSRTITETGTGEPDPVPSYENHEFDTLLPITFNPYGTPPDYVTIKEAEALHAAIRGVLGHDKDRLRLYATFERESYNVRFSWSEWQSARRQHGANSLEAGRLEHRHKAVALGSFMGLLRGTWYDIRKTNKWLPSVVREQLAFSRMIKTFASILREGRSADEVQALQLSKIYQTIEHTLHPLLGQMGGPVTEDSWKIIGLNRTKFWTLYRRIEKKLREVKARINADTSERRKIEVPDREPLVYQVGTAVQDNLPVGHIRNTWPPVIVKVRPLIGSRVTAVLLRDELLKDMKALNASRVSGYPGPALAGNNVLLWYHHARVGMEKAMDMLEYTVAPPYRSMEDDTHILPLPAHDQEVARAINPGLDPQGAVHESMLYYEYLTGTSAEAMAGEQIPLPFGAMDLHEEGLSYLFDQDTKGVDLNFCWADVNNYCLAYGVDIQPRELFFQPIWGVKSSQKRNLAQIWASLTGITDQERTNIVMVDRTDEGRYLFYTRGHLAHFIALMKEQEGEEKMFDKEFFEVITCCNEVDIHWQEFCHEENLFILSRG